MTQEVDFLLIGGGLASTTTAETLRSEGAQGSIVMLAAEPVLPYHRPPLSKDCLLKDEGFERLLIQPEAFYRDHNIEVRLGTRATRLDARHKLVATGREGTFRYRQLLIATGARVRRLRMPGAQLKGVHYLRTVKDAERLRKAMATSKQAVVVASSFIAMEVAAACITRGIHTTIIAKEKLLYDRLESPEVSTFFYQYLETHLPGIYAAGDIAKFFDPVFRRNRRIEHWDNALKQGRIAARNMLGCHESYRAVSYFFSNVLDLSFNFIGDVDGTTRRIVRGAPASSSFAVLYLRDEQLTAGFVLNRPIGEERAIGSLILNRIPLDESQTLGDVSLPLGTWAKQTVLILQGGGALGAFECGAVKALEENGIYADVAAGVSIGAFNAAIVASHPRRAAAALEAFWRELAICTPVAPNDEARRALSSWYASVFGVPKFFRPRWLIPMLSVQEWSHYWTSFYDPSPIKDLLRKYVDFKQLKDSPVRLLVNAVNVETAEIETFDSYIEEITPDHLVASGSLPPGFPWTTIHGKHYWDGGIVSNSPIDQVTERCGLTDKRVYIVNLFPGSARLPRDLPEVMARRDEIVYAERLNRDVRTRDLLDNYGKLVNELMSELDPSIAERVQQRPLYIDTVGTTGPISVTRIVHTGEPGEGPSKDYEFSAETVEEHIEVGYIAACEALKATGK